MQLISVLLAQQYDTPADKAAGLITTLGAVIIPLVFGLFGYKLLRMGSRSEKSGIEFMGLKVNLESTTGGFLIVAALIGLLKFYGKFYSS
ncbi:hypothetical protein ACN4EK_00055 [Pantanalinema rosaneae CENA516]|uniref:hypothetical protein n=1 Tax=Pantanalinema rosaneae TaxID=1620701 RepID=UPI003D6FBAB6